MAKKVEEKVETKVTDDKSEIRLNLFEPRATEKSYGEQAKRVYVFQVEKSMGKQAIVEKVEKEFNVTVTDVKTLVRKGKKTRFSRGKRAYPEITYRQDKKYAYVRLAKGDSIRVFEEEDKDKASAPKTRKKADKTEKTDKNAGKENK